MENKNDFINSFNLFFQRYSLDSLVNCNDLNYLFQEYRLTIGMDNSINDKQQIVAFTAHLLNKRSKMREYVNMMKHIGINQDKTIAELNKSYWDSITTVLQEDNYDALALTPYVDSFLNTSQNNVYNGVLSVQEKKPIIWYPTKEEMLTKPNCHIAFNEQIGTLATQLPIQTTDHDLTALFTAATSNLELFIGYYGNVYDKDIKDKETLLIKLKELLIAAKVPIKEERDIVDDTVLHIIKTHNETRTR